MKSEMYACLSFMLIATMQATAPATKSGLAILERVQSARKSIIYAATVETITLQPRPRAVTAHVYHKSGKERIEYSFQGITTLILIDDGERIYRLHPHARIAYVRASLCKELNAKLLHRNYKIHLLEDEVVAKRKCFVLSIQPKYAGNPSRKMWIDKATYVMLRNETYDGAGALVAMTVYRNIVYDINLDDELFKVPKGWRTVNDSSVILRELNRSKIESIVGFPLKLPRFIPQGYHLDSVEILRCCHGMPIVHMRYTDGLNCLSVFEHLSCTPKRWWR
ncbi:MAG TPA: outer membrane lipoprotein-sorting protein, partial [Armatimonadetes bacterium]|nr:outer membrane lipoprotein-sorting protein [Armatimonadota bacterium]